MPQLNVFREKNSLRMFWGPLRLEIATFRSFFHLYFEFSDENMTFSGAFPGLAAWFSLSNQLWPISKIYPRRVFQPISTGDDIFSRMGPCYLPEHKHCGISVHDWTLRISPWTDRDSWMAKDPWWKRGVHLELNPFRAEHVTTEVVTEDGEFVLKKETWERSYDGVPDNRHIQSFHYRYALKNGSVQERTAKVYIERMTWRPRLFKRLGWNILNKSRTSIDVEFSDEVGEESGSWKGGCMGCGYTMLPGESAEQCLRRMERERKF